MISSHFEKREQEGAEKIVCKSLHDDETLRLLKNRAIMQIALYQED